MLQTVKKSNYNIEQTNTKGNGLPTLSELIIRPSGELAEEVMTLRLELETEKRSCAVLRTGLEQQQRTAQENRKNIVREHKQRLHSQKEEYEAAITRHQGFIDQLIADKTAMGAKCEKKEKELRAVEKRNSENMKAMEARHSMEMRR